MKLVKFFDLRGSCYRDEKLYLTLEEKAHLELLHSTSDNKKESYRIKAVLLRSEGWNVPMISQALRLHQTTINRHINDYQEGKLKLASGGSESYLNQDMTEKLVNHLEENTYHQRYPLNMRC